MSESEHCGLITQELVEKMRKASFIKEAQAHVTDEEALGVHISNYFAWNGGSIIRAFYAALEDANFHTENEKLVETFPWAFPEFQEAEVEAEAEAEVEVEVEVEEAAEV